MSTMKIQVYCFATLSGYAPGDGQLDIHEGATPEDVINRLSIPPQDVKVVFVNGRNQGRDVVLNENDRVGIFPAIGGG